MVPNSAVSFWAEDFRTYQNCLLSLVCLFVCYASLCISSSLKKNTFTTEYKEYNIQFKFSFFTTKQKLFMIWLDNLLQNNLLY